MSVFLAEPPVVEAPPELHHWPPEGTPSFVSETAQDGTWKPLCTEHEGRTLLYYRFTPWGSWHCPECGVMHLIWAEDWPDAPQDDDEPTPVQAQ